MFFPFDFVDGFDGMHGLFYIVSYLSKYSTLRGQNPIDSSIVPPDATHSHTFLHCPVDLVQMQHYGICYNQPWPVLEPA